MDCGKPDDEGNGGRCAYVAGLPAAEILREHCGGERAPAGLGKRCTESGAGLYYGKSAVCWSSMANQRASGGLRGGL